MIQYSVVEKTNAFRIAQGAVNQLSKFYGLGDAVSVSGAELYLARGKVSGNSAADKAHAWRMDLVELTDLILSNPDYNLYEDATTFSIVKREFADRANRLFHNILNSLLP